MMSRPDPPIHFDANGLAPAVIQEAATHNVLMVGFMNAAALAATRESGRVHFWSRSRRTLWRKGETSGHEQMVREIFVNCEQNSLLITVDQVGAVCHDGYPACFYRRLRPDNRLVIVHERVFDPATVYPPPVGAQADLAALSLAHYEGFAYLRDHDLTSESATSALLRAAEPPVGQRIADELRELAGVLDGSHAHTELTSDLLLEGSQVLYWLTLAALHARLPWDELRPDRALATSADGIAAATVSRLLRADARHWEAASEPGSAAPRLHATLALVGQAVHLGGITPHDLIAADLAELQSKPYMRPYFSAATPNDQASV